jgi:hypothetical protein
MTSKGKEGFEDASPMPKLESYDTRTRSVSQKGLYQGKVEVLVC